MHNQKTVPCPICGKKNRWSQDNVYRPFCSERCKMIDLGEWASGTRVIPGEPVDPNSVLQDDDDWSS